MMDAVAAQAGLATAVTGALIGREIELAQAQQAIAEPADVGVIIAGDAGVGKTRLISEVIRLARADGACVLLGHCLHFGGDAVPYLPISEAFGRLARDEPELVDQLRADLPPIDRLLPQRRLIGADADANRPLRLADLFAAVLAALVRVSETRPVVLVLEDLHWADSSTRDLIGFLFARVRGERVTVVVSYRADDLHRRHPLRPVLIDGPTMAAASIER